MSAGFLPDRYTRPFSCDLNQVRARNHGHPQIPPISSSNALPNPCRNSFGKIAELHFHPYRDVALNLNNLAARYAPLFNSSKLVRDTLILS